MGFLVGLFCLDFAIGFRIALRFSPRYHLNEFEAVTMVFDEAETHREFEASTLCLNALNTSLYRAISRAVQRVFGDR